MNIPAFVGGLGIWRLLEYVTHLFVLYDPLIRCHLPHHVKPTGEDFD